MHTRIRKIRKSQPKKEQRTQQAFADKLNISRSQLSYYESGTVAIPDRSVKDICEKYNVNEEWLKNGTGPMYKPRSDNEIIAKFVNDVMESRSDDFRKRLINALSQLDEDEWKVLEEIAKKMQ